MNGPDLADEYNTILGGEFLPESTNSSSPSEGASNIQSSEPPEFQHLVECPDPVQYGKWQVLSVESYERQGRKADATKEKYKGCCMILRQKITGFGVIEKHQLEIQSEFLRSVFKKRAKHYRELSVESNPIVIPRPFRPLFFLRDALREEANAAKLPREKEELELLLQFINSKEGLQEVISKHENLVPQKKVSFDILWTLYPPHELVYYHNDEEGLDQCYVVEFVTRSVGDGVIQIVFNLLEAHHDGTKFGICRQTLAIPAFIGNVGIILNDLPIIPLRYLADKEQLEIKTKLKTRGREYCFLQSQKFTLMDYAGPIWRVGGSKVTEMNYSFEGKWVRIRTNGRVVVDPIAARAMSYVSSPATIAPCFEMFIRSFGKEDENLSRPASLKSSDSSMILEYRRTPKVSKNDWIQVTLPDQLRNEKEQHELAETDYLLCPPRTKAFLLDKKIWILALVNELYDINWYPEPFETLQLAKEKKALIQALVESFNTNEGFVGFDDVVQGKGKGLIFLLYGAPGLGKTYTAETIAEQTKRPLYHVTTGELSTDVAQMEKQMESIFKLGWRWGAVVLIDEADVLMSKRDLQELSRSAIVAVFLRLIEYYQGLLFLTTNRKEDFDEAFYNRIHVIIKYPELDVQARTNIWQYLLTKKRNAIKLDASWSDHEFRILGDLQCNGRDIRNLIRTAYGYSNFQKKELSVHHLVTVLRENMNIVNVEKIASRLEGALEMTAIMPPKALSGFDTRQKTARPGDVSHERNEAGEKLDQETKHETAEVD